MSVSPNFKMGIGFDQGVFTTLENSGNYKYHRGIFINQSRVPIILVKDNLGPISPPSYSAFQSNQEIPMKLANPKHHSGPGFSTLVAASSRDLEQMKNPVLSNTRDNYYT